MEAAPEIPENREGKSTLGLKSPGGLFTLNPARLISTDKRTPWLLSPHSPFTFPADVYPPQGSRCSGPPGTRHSPKSLHPAQILAPFRFPVKRNVLITLIHNIYQHISTDNHVLLARSGSRFRSPVNGDRSD